MRWHEYLITPFLKPFSGFFLLLDDFVDVGRFLFKDTRHCDLIAFFNFLIILKGGVVRFEETDSNLYEWCSIN